MNRATRLTRSVGVGVKRVLAGFVLLCLAGAALAQRNAVHYDGELYVALSALGAPEFLNGSTELERGGQSLGFRTAKGQWSFAQGGSVFCPQEGEEVPLKRPLLTLSDGHYVCAQEGGVLLGFTVDTAGSQPLVRLEGKELRLRCETLSLPCETTRISPLEPLRRAVRLHRPLAALAELSAHARPVELASGERLIVRRRVQLNERSYFVVTRNAPTLESYLVLAEALEASAQADELEGSCWGKLRQELAQLAQQERGIDYGVRERLARTVALTVDMCWSLRPAERQMLEALAAEAASAQTTTCVTLFMSGRWMEEHPEEMHWLLELSRSPWLEVSWGLHSWAHPKEGGFMNDFSVEEFRADVLRLERTLLRWGILPSVYYRFPGLIHDSTRLEACLELDLVAFDCDSWMAMARMGRPPHRMEPQDGSILLIHGNGNEPKGITAYQSWREEHPQWQLAAPHRFVHR